ncbi:WAS/WASL-interacting protein family member 1-like [Symphalangus syndactylus]|uniref:WAS/WASL-interacting protein family member 1-like n=1 Tax=Symphalangus syndactylus TaxID=9590 RepID=UPI002441A019|nr:WAS/WASL-interacting protein family member 1-like [Symphalangus syndactylus]
MVGNESALGGKHRVRQRISGPRWLRRAPRPRLGVNVPPPSSPGHCPGPGPEPRRPLPTAPPRGLRPKPSAPALPVASRSQPFRVACSPRVKDVAGDGQVPAPGYHQATQHKNAVAHAKYERPQFAPTP